MVAGKATIIALRRRRVAEFRLRNKMTEREIVDALGKGDDPILNPTTGKPYTLPIIHKDLVYLQDLWTKEATASIGEWKTRLINEVEEVKRAAWEYQQYETVLKGITQQRKIMGIDAPVKIAPVTPDGEKPYESLSDEERAACLAALFDAARERASKPPDAGAK